MSTTVRFGEARGVVAALEVYGPEGIASLEDLYAMLLELRIQVVRADEVMEGRRLLQRLACARPWLERSPGFRGGPRSLPSVRQSARARRAGPPERGHPGPQGASSLMHCDSSERARSASWMPSRTRSPESARRVRRMSGVIL